MLLHATILEEFPTVGASVVHWIRKVTQTSFSHLFHKFCTLFTLCSYFCVSIQFPFFCSDREYTIGRRIWESERSFYCVTKVLNTADGVKLVCVVINVSYLSCSRVCRALRYKESRNHDELIFTTQVGSFDQVLWYIVVVQYLDYWGVSIWIHLNGSVWAMFYLKWVNVKDLIKKVTGHTVTRIRTCQNSFLMQKKIRICTRQSKSRSHGVCCPIVSQSKSSPF